MSDYPKLIAVSRRYLRWFDVPERPRLVADTVIDESYGRDRDTALFPSRRILACLSGVHENHIAGVLSWLQHHQIILVEDPGRYTFKPSPDSWLVKRKPISAQAGVLQVIMDRAWREPEQLSLFAQDKTLADVLSDLQRMKVLEQHDQEITMQQARESLGLDRFESTKLVESTESVDCIHGYMNNIYNPCIQNRGIVKGEFTKSVESVLMDRLARFIGPDFPKYVRIWERRITEMPGLVEEVLAECKVEMEIPGRQPIRNPGAWMSTAYWTALHRLAASGNHNAQAIATAYPGRNA